MQRAQGATLSARSGDGEKKARKKRLNVQGIFSVTAAGSSFHQLSTCPSPSDHMSSGGTFLLIRGGNNGADKANGETTVSNRFPTFCLFLALSPEALLTVAAQKSSVSNKDHSYYQAGESSCRATRDTCLQVDVD